ncbi:MAG: P-II family nitrogen regulator [Gemmatimonadota bacterium]
MSESTKLLVAVIQDPTKLDEVLAGFLGLGITGATVLQSEGMGRLLSQEIPIFAGLQSLVATARPQNRMILSVVGRSKVEPAVKLLQDICGGLDSPGTGIAFTLPVDAVFGLAPVLTREGAAEPEG